MSAQKKIYLVLTVILTFTLLLPQSALADSNNDSSDSKVQTYYRLEKRGGAELATRDSLRVYWGDLTTNGQQYRISWKKKGAKKWRSMDIDDPEPSYDKAKSCLITGLETNQEYDIRIHAILRNEKGEKILTKPLEVKGYTYVTAPEYMEPYSNRGNGEYIELTWGIYEKNALLKIYRADKKNGKYRLIASTDGRTDQNHSNYKDRMGRIVYYDKKIEAGKAYYYKAVSELILDDGSVMKAVSPKSYHVSAQNRPYGRYTNTFINKRGTYAKALTWKVSSDKANYDTKLVKKQIMFYTWSSKTGDQIMRKPVSVQYSYNGKKYYNMKDAFTLKPGKTVYLRANLKNRIWIRKDGKGCLEVNITYRHNKLAEQGYLLAMTLNIDGKLDVYDPDEGDGFDDYDESIDQGWEECYAIEHFHGISGVNRTDLLAKINKEKNVVLSWNLCPYAESYTIQYGATEKEAKSCKPIQVQRGQFAYEIKGLTENEQYYFILSEVAEDENGKLQNTPRPYGTVYIPEGEWQENEFYCYHDGPELSMIVTEDKTIALEWNPCADGYKIQYGASEEEARECEPIIITDRETHHYEIKNPPKDLCYLFFTELTKDENGQWTESGLTKVITYVSL